MIEVIIVRWGLLSLLALVASFTILAVIWIVILILDGFTDRWSGQGDPDNIVFDTEDEADYWRCHYNLEEEPVTRRLPTKKFDEYDVTTHWRHLLTSFQRADAVSKIKRRIRRRERHVGKHRMRHEDDL